MYGVSMIFALDEGQSIVLVWQCANQTPFSRLVCFSCELIKKTKQNEYYQ